MAPSRYVAFVVVTETARRFLQRKRSWAMNAWPPLVRGARAIWRGRSFTRPASAPTIRAVEEFPEAQPLIEQTSPGAIGPDELLAPDRKLEKVLQKSGERPSRRPIKEDAAP